MGNAGEGHTLAFSPDGRTLAGGGDGWVALWDAETGHQKARQKRPGRLDKLHRLHLRRPNVGAYRSLACLKRTTQSNSGRWAMATGWTILHRDSSTIYSFTFHRTARYSPAATNAAGWSSYGTSGPPPNFLPWKATCITPPRSSMHRREDTGVGKRR